MSALASAAAVSLRGLLAGQPRLPASPLARLNALRAEAVDRVGVLAVPTIRDEDWRFTDVSPLTRLALRAIGEPTVLGAADIERFALPEAGCRLVFVDGVYAENLSRLPASEAVVVANLGAASEALPVAVERHLGRLAEFRDQAFTALNTAFLRDAALVLVPRGMAISAPVHLLFIATQALAASHPRCLVVAQPGSAVTFVEDYVYLHDGSYFTNAVAEISVADDARVTHVRVQRENPEAFHVASCAVSLGRGGRYHGVSVALGARISRYDLRVLQAAEGAECAIDGLALIGGGQLADFHSLIDHAKPQGSSRQLQKCIVGGGAHAVFNGKIVVRRDAQRTDSSQSSRNLLLGGKARVDTKPQLEIFADDVKCAHGATVGQLDDEARFYLTSRGLSAAAARNLLVYAFGAEIIERVPVASLRQELERTMLEHTASES